MKLQPKAASNHYGGKWSTQPFVMQPPSSAIISVRPHEWSSPAGSTDSFQSPSSIPHNFRFSLVNIFLLPVDFSNTVPSLCTAAASSWSNVYCIRKEKENLTFLGFGKITPSTNSLVISLYRQTDKTSQTLLKQHQRGQWTDKIMHLICTLNNTSHQDSWIPPHKIVYSLLILVVYAKMHKFQSQYVSLTRWQTCT